MCVRMTDGSSIGCQFHLVNAFCDDPFALVKTAFDLNPSRITIARFDAALFECFPLLMNEYDVLAVIVVNRRFRDGNCLFFFRCVKIHLEYLAYF